MGLFKSAEEKKEEQIKKLEKQIEQYNQCSSSDQAQHVYKKKIAAIEKLEKLVGTENLRGDYVETLMYCCDSQHGSERDETAIERIYPAYSRYYYEEELGWILKSLDKRHEFIYNNMVKYLIGGRYEWELSIVACPDLDLAMAFAEKVILWEQENGIPEDKKAGAFFLQLIRQLKEAGYPGTETKWERRIWWMLKHMENPAVGFLFDAMLERGSCPLNSENMKYMLSHQELENLKTYSRNENMQKMVMKEWSRRFPAEK